MAPFKNLLYKFPRSFATAFSAKSLSCQKMSSQASKELLGYASPDHL